MLTGHRGYQAYHLAHKLRPAVQWSHKGNLTLCSLQSSPVCPASNNHILNTMNMGKLVRILKHNPKYPFKLFVGTNAFILMFFMLITSKNSSHNNDIVSDTKKHKFANFNVSSWNESQSYKLPKIDEELFV